MLGKSLRGIWGYFKKRLQKTTEADAHKQRLLFAKAKRSILSLPDSDEFILFLEGRIFDNFEAMRQSARHDKQFYIGYYSGRMDEAEEIKIGIENSVKDVENLEKRYKNKKDDQ